MTATVAVCRHPEARGRCLIYRTGRPLGAPGAPREARPDALTFISGVSTFSQGSGDFFESGGKNSADTKTNHRLKIPALTGIEPAKYRIEHATPITPDSRLSPIRMAPLARPVRTTGPVRGEEIPRLRGSAIFSTGYLIPTIPRRRKSCC